MCLAVFSILNYIPYGDKPSFVKAPWLATESLGKGTALGFMLVIKNSGPTKIAELFLIEKNSGKHPSQNAKR